MECKQLPMMPASHDYFGQAVTLDNSIYLFGGTTNGDVSKFDNLSGSWKRLPNSDIISQRCYAGYLLPHSGDALSASEAPSLSEGFGLLLSERQPQEARTAQTHHGLANDPDEVDFGCDAPHSDSETKDGTLPRRREGVVNIRFSNPPQTGHGCELFRLALLEGKEFKQCRKDLVEAGLDVVLGSRAVVLVRPDQYHDALRAVAIETLKPYNVLVSESLEYLLDEVLAGMAFKQRPKSKDPRCEIELHPDREQPFPDRNGSVSLIGNASFDGEGFFQEGQAFEFFRQGQTSQLEVIVVFFVSRTFIDVHLVLRDRTTVVQSSTDSAGLRATRVSSRGVNPCRVD
mmetsp:Transcript_42173/g.136464  ORF Transcript_42173/g.136464 Transcript_42173/m.136464 type:complete len:344 (-) Transcript_42173:163-1194(-)